MKKTKLQLLVYKVLIRYLYTNSCNFIVEVLVEVVIVINDEPFIVEVLVEVVIVVNDEPIYDKIQE